MNKTEAQKLSDKGGYKVADLHAVIASARGRRKMSLVNSAIPYEQVLDIYESALAGRSDDEEIKAWIPDVYSRSGAMKRTKDNLIVKNILRDCLA